MSVSASHYAWLAAYYSALRNTGVLEVLAPPGRAEALAAAIEADYPTKAQEIRQWNRATREAMLGVLDDLTINGSVQRETYLWQAMKGDRTLYCVAVQLPQGIDLRLLAEELPERTMLISDRPEVHREADRWQMELAANGWDIRNT